VLKYKED